MNGGDPMEGRPAVATVDARYDESLNQLTRDTFDDPEVQGFYETRLTPRRAQIIAQQFGLFVRGRRSAWAYLIARCPHMEVKKELLAHETEEMLFDPRCGSDHYTLWVRHGEAVGLSADEVHHAQPLPTTRAAICGWSWLAFNLSWLEGLGGVAVLERVNLDPIIPGGAHQTRAQERWTRDLGLTWSSYPISSCTARPIPTTRARPWSCWPTTPRRMSSGRAFWRPRGSRWSSGRCFSAASPGPWKPSSDRVRFSRNTHEREGEEPWHD